MKRNRILNIIGLFAFVIASLVSCKKKDGNPITNPPPHNEEELITTMKLTFVDSAGIEPNKEFVFRDADGPGGNAPSDFDTLFLSSNKSYYVTLSLLNESVSPAKDITTEILAEANEHLFCFIPNIGANLSVQRTDSDGTYELGVTSTWRTIASSNGSVLIKLKHQPGIKNGQCDIGETDIELNFQLKIQ